MHDGFDLPIFPGLEINSISIEGSLNRRWGYFFRNVINGNS